MRKKSEELEVLERKNPLKTLIDQEVALYKEIKKQVKEDVDAMANRISVEVAFALADQFEDLNVQEYKFRQGVHRMARWVLLNLLKSQEDCVVVPDGLPGFTVMAFKRVPIEYIGGDEPFELNPESKVASIIIEQYLKDQEDDHHIVVIEAPDVLLILFPVQDTKSNLKKMGLIS